MTSQETAESFLTGSFSMRNHISYVSELYLSAETMVSLSKCMQPGFVTLIYKYGMGNFRQAFL